MNPRRVVLDTNVLVSALMSPSGNPAKIYKMFFTGDLGLVYNESILSEYDDVLHRPYLRIPDEDAGKVINAIKMHGEHNELGFDINQFMDDHVKVYTTDFEDLIFVYTVNKIIFTDGTMKER